MYTKGKRSKVESLLEDNRVDFIALADYSEGGELDTIIRDILYKMAMVNSLKNRNKSQLKAIKKMRVYYDAEPSNLQ